MSYQHITPPNSGHKISTQNGTLMVPNQVIIPFIEGDGIGRDITPVMQQVIDSAVKAAYRNNKKIHWLEIYAGEKAYKLYGQWLPSKTLSTIKNYHIAIKGPLTTPVGSGVRSLNVAIRQRLDLFVCMRPVRYFTGTPSPVKHPQKINMVVFRENSEDIYSGIEYQAGTKKAKKMVDFLQNETGSTKIRFPKSCSIGIKPVSKAGTQRLVRSAIAHAIDHDKPSVTLVHKGNIMKFTEGSFCRWGYELAQTEFGAKPMDNNTAWQVLKNPKTGRDIIIKDVITDSFLQQILLRPEDYSVIATLNLNGDYISDALAAQVGGIGIVPGANLSDSLAVFEAIHGTAPKHAGLDKVNPSSLILSAEMMLRYLGWTAAADLVINAVAKTITDKTLTYDLERLMAGATLVSCTEFGQKIIDNIG